MAFLLNRFPGSGLDNLILTPFWQGKRHRKQPTSLALNTFKIVFSRVLLPESSALGPKKIQEFLKLGGGGGKGGKLQPQAPPWPERQEFWSEFVDFVCTDFVHI